MTGMCRIRAHRPLDSRSSRSPSPWGPGAFRQTAAITHRTTTRAIYTVRGYAETQRPLHLLMMLDAFLGVSFDPQSRPIARGVVGFISRLLGYLAIPWAALVPDEDRTLTSRLIVHYWLTRKTTTGIAILTQTGQSLVYLISYIVITAVGMDGIPVLTFIVVIGTFLAIIAKQLQLCFRPEFKTEFYPIPTGSNLRAPVPVAVRFRHHSVAEASSFKEDARFPWWLRVLVSMRDMKRGRLTRRSWPSHLPFCVSRPPRRPSSRPASGATSCTALAGRCIGIRRPWRRYISSRQFRAPSGSAAS